MSPEAQWSLNTFRTLRQDGAWGVPRSGLIFRKRGETLVLVSVMPHDPAMPISADDLRKQQESELEGITRYMGEAGVKVIKECEI